MLTLHTPLTLDNLSSHMISVEAGSFDMGGEFRDNEKPIHRVTLTRDFALCRYPVTQALWAVVMEDNPQPSHFKGAQRPVEQVSWYDAVSFCNALSKQQGLAPAYEIDPHTQDPNNQSSFDEQKWTVKPIKGAKGYRLPTEAEWEYAARGGPCRRGPEGNGFAYAGSPDLDQVGWYSKNSGSETQPVGEKRPNELGLYDLSGNVREWCWDWFGNYSGESQVDPAGPEGGSDRVYRGGGWLYGAVFCRVANRLLVRPDRRYDDVGFRLARHV